jgi:phage tail sheath protein FI
MVDNARGVWKAPANVALVNVISTAVDISSAEQEDLNIAVDGKSVNAIRYFTGHGILVWGARTLEGNSSDWKYINVRRTMIMVQQSIKIAVKAYIYEPNNASTWVTLSGVIQNFLLGIWKRGGFAGAKPEQAFFVQIGLGMTMTAQDILDGIMIINVGVAIARPAEFIVISFQQQMQQS